MVKVAVIGHCHTGLSSNTSTCTVTSTNVRETVTYECKEGMYHEYEPIDTDRKYELIEQKFIRHRANRVKPSKVKTKQRAGTKFMWHKQN